LEGAYHEHSKEKGHDKDHIVFFMKASPHFMVKQHSEIGEDILGKVDFLKPIAASVRHHHDR